MDRKIYAMIPGHEDADSEDSAMEELVRRRPGSTTSGQRVTEAEKRERRGKIQSKKATSLEADHSCGSSLGACDRNRNNRSRVDRRESWRWWKEHLAEEMLHE